MAERRFSTKLIDVPLSGEGASQEIAQAVRECLAGLETTYGAKATIHEVQTDSFLAHSVVMVRVNVVAEMDHLPPAEAPRG